MPSLAFSRFLPRALPSADRHHSVTKHTVQYGISVYFLITMLRRDHKKIIALLLLPLLLGFSFQWALEVFHPLEEDFSASHQHSGTGEVVHASYNRVDGHASHACPHSSAFAQFRLLSSSSANSQACATKASFSDTLITSYASNVLGRGPPRA